MPFRKKPVEVGAIQWRGDNWIETAKFHQGDHFTTTTMPDGVYLNIATLEGVMQARPGDWIIEGVKGEVYPCKPDILKRHTNRGSGIRRIGLATQSVLTVIAIWDVAELRD